jgi:hypothetical protein
MLHQLSGELDIFRGGEGWNQIEELEDEADLRASKIGELALA